jgi:hypothetical protein
VRLFGFELTTPVFERVKRIIASDRTATVIDWPRDYPQKEKYYN